MTGLLSLCLLPTLLPGVGRQTLDLDSGWEFARIPNPPSVWNGPDAVPTAAWRVAEVSSQETTGEMGAGTWEMFDHNVPWDFAVSASGLADLMRREKPSFWFFASQTVRTPYLRVAAEWQPGAKTRRVVVFTNAAKASLFVNGRLLQTASAVRGAETPYDLKRAFDGTNTANLPRPPIVFRDVPFTGGELKVVGSNGAFDTTRTSGKPARLRVWVDDLGVPPTANDLVFVRAAVVDGNGNVCLRESREVRFAGATFAGENHSTCEMGVASVLVRTPPRKGSFSVRATAGVLQGGCQFKF